MPDFFIKSFPELSTNELYQILQLRAMVFVVEQDCPYQDADGLDYEAFHILRYSEDGTLLAYSRMLPPGKKYDHEVCISRVVSHPEYRKKNHGRELLRFTIDKCSEIYPLVAIKISAQLYLKLFYESFGFRQISSIYLEDNIPHIAMIRGLESSL